jgi:hypothetical protein
VKTVKVYLLHLMSAEGMMDQMLLANHVTRLDSTPAA